MVKLYETAPIYLWNDFNNFRGEYGAAKIIHFTAGFALKTYSKH